jgi:hypothetical protein
MLYNTSEKTMRLVRWTLTLGWFILIGSLFYDPWTAALTDPQNLASPLRLRLDPEQCVKLRDVCLTQTPYQIGAMVWWSVIVPSSIFILLVFGHEFWRRICPLSFVSQIPRALGIQRKKKITHPKTGTVRFELVKISDDSWLGQNHLYVQFGLFIFGLLLRLVLVDSHRFALGCFLLFTIAAAVTIGYLYAGKSWCQYFCPMAPVQLVYTGPRGLLGSQAPKHQISGVTQSMCRTIDSQTGQMQSACVGCKATCVDIDAEKHYWDDMKKPQRRLVQYGYFGMVVAFGLSYCLYSGNHQYYFSGIWTHDDRLHQNPFAEMFDAGYHLYGHTIPIPKVLAVMITFTVCIIAAYILGMLLEKLSRKYVRLHNRSLSLVQARHLVFTLATVFSFWTFFSYAARPFINRFPSPIVLGFNALIMLVSSIWLFRTLKRKKRDYDREAMAGSLRQQLKRLTVDSNVLEGRSIDDLNPDELHMLVKVLPGFSEQQRRGIYSGVLQDCLMQKMVNVKASFEFCETLRRELQLEDAVHFEMLSEIIRSQVPSEDDAAPIAGPIPPTSASIQSAVTVARTIAKQISPPLAARQRLGKKS